MQSTHATTVRKHVVSATDTAMLQRLMELRLLKVAEKALRQELIQLVEAGATVEAGPLSIALEQREFCVPTWPALELIFDRDGIDFIRSQIEPRKSMYLKVKQESVRRATESDFWEELQLPQYCTVDEEGLAD